LIFQYLQDLPSIQGYYRVRIDGVKQPDKVFENGLEYAQLKLMKKVNNEHRKKIEIEKS
jgi:hypothetical protein